jgi:hypothetical protein
MAKPGKPKLTAYQRVKRAALKGRGCYLTFDECLSLYAFDTAFRDRADMDELDWKSLDDPTSFKKPAARP